ncbi:MAG: helix-turn-helix transcriptional regulator [Clostridia bacterium]|nr:helix-turn-helix transcriptional regulator [Clostridia bacterium]
MSGKNKELWFSPNDIHNLNENRLINIEKTTLDEDFAMHWHEHFEIEFIIGGLGKGKINGVEYNLTPGDIYILSTTDFHDLYNKENPLTLYTLNFEQNALEYELSEKILSNKSGNLFFHLESSEYQWMKTIFDMIYQELTVETEIRKKCAQNLLNAVVYFLLQHTKLSDENVNTEKTHISLAIAYLELNFRKEITLDEVADYVGLNKNYLCSLFHKETGKKMVRYLNDLRLHYSRKLLRSTYLSVSEVSSHCGFKTLSTYLHEFKSKYNETPQQYRTRKAK